MTIKLPISHTDLTNMLDTLETGTIEVVQGNTIRIGFLGSIIDIFTTTGNYRNLKTNKKGQGKDDLYTYLSWLKENKNTSQKSSQSDSKSVSDSDLEKRIAELENTVERLSQRLETLDEALRNIL